MADHVVQFDTGVPPVRVPTGTLLAEAARLAGVEINQPCGGQGRCGRCAVQVTSGTVRRRSTLRLSADDIADGFALACQTVVEGDVTVHVPPQEQIERHLTTERVAVEMPVPPGYDPASMQPVRRVSLTLPPPSLEDQTDDWSRLKTALRQQAGIEQVEASLEQIRGLGRVLRQADWQVAVTVEMDSWDRPGGPARLIRVEPGPAAADAPLWGLAIDIGTTTVSVWLVDLLSGEVKAQAAEYNGQIARGEDVISRIIYASKGDGLAELSALVLKTINTLIGTLCKRVQIQPEEIVRAAISGNSTMIHLLLAIPPESIRLEPFVTAINQPPTLPAHQIGVAMHPDGIVDCLPGVASYVGADITAGVLSSGMQEGDDVVLFIDVGTNGEMVLGSSDWLVTCACSAGPAFEGAGVTHGMRASQGAIEEVWINSSDYEPTYRVIGGVKPRGLCGSGLISLIAEMFLTGVLDKAGNINLALDTPRVREGAHGPEYVVAWAGETAAGEDIVITRVDIDNLLRAKAAIYAGFLVLAESVGIPLEAAQRVLIGGSFGKYINVEKAVEIGLLPDVPWDRFSFLGNTSVKGAYLALLDRGRRARIGEIASSMTYIELSADNSFYEAFMSALFLPHTDLSRFPTVAAALGYSDTR
ncbi:MAG: ASKHA domain-containing protein [Anaerolineae bacterium]